MKLPFRFILPISVLVLAAAVWWQLGRLGPEQRLFVQSLTQLEKAITPAHSLSTTLEVLRGRSRRPLM